MSTILLNLSVSEIFKMKNSYFSSIKDVISERSLMTLVYENGNKITLVSTAHVSARSVKDVEEAIKNLKPDCIAVELDKARLNTLAKKDYKDLDVFQILKKGQGYFFLAQLLLSFYQKYIAKQTGSEPGGEMKKAISLAKQEKKKLLLIDRPVDVTLRRIMGSMGFFRRFGVLFSLINFDGDNFLGNTEKNTEASSNKKSKNLSLSDHVEQLRSQAAVQKIRNQMRDHYPEVVGALLDERDCYMARMIEKEMAGKKNYHLLAVVGAAHSRGMVEAFLGMPFVDLPTDELLKSPPKGRGLKIFSYGIVALIVGIFLVGFFTGDYETFKEGFFIWFLFNGVFGALGAALALAHPLTIISAFFVSPFTSLNPALPAGAVCGMIEVFLRPPKVSDFQQLELKLSSFKSWWKNRFTRVFLVFFFTNLGSALGAWISLPALMGLFL